jgi:hypothetical protein
MKRSKPMNRQLSLSLGSEPAACESAADLTLQQWQELESALADLLLHLAASSGFCQGGSNDK